MSRLNWSWSDSEGRRWFAIEEKHIPAIRAALTGTLGLVASGALTTIPNADVDSFQDALGAIEDAAPVAPTYAEEFGSKGKRAS